MTRNEQVLNKLVDRLIMMDTLDATSIKTMRRLISIIDARLTQLETGDIKPLNPKLYGDELWEE